VETLKLKHARISGDAVFYAEQVDLFPKSPMKTSFFHKEEPGQSITVFLKYYDALAGTLKYAVHVFNYRYSGSYKIKNKTKVMSELVSAFQELFRLSSNTHIRIYEVL
jgi:hypothetical protein